MNVINTYTIRNLEELEKILTKFEEKFNSLYITDFENKDGKCIAVIVKDSSFMLYEKEYIIEEFENKIKIYYNDVAITITENGKSIVVIR